MEQKTTKLEILQAINKFATNVEENFTEVKQDIKDIKKRVTNLEVRVTTVEKRTTSIESQMVTKSYLDDKLADLHGETLKVTRQTNDKIVCLTQHLHEEENLSNDHFKEVVALPPFARISS